MTDRVYKIAHQTEWDEMAKTGTFSGSADDKRDGFIHLSAAGQVRATFERYFAAEDNLLLVTLESARLGPALKWEPSRRGEPFPHLYAPLPMGWVHSVIPIRRDGNGRPIFPLEIL